MLIITDDYITQTVAPTAEPVTRTEAKLYARVDISTDDTLIDALIKAAREEVEAYTGRAFVSRTYRADIPYFDDCMELPRKPIISISHIKYYSNASPSVLTTLAASNYELTRDKVVRAYGGTWPAVDSRAAPIQITYTAGYASTSSPLSAASDVPVAVKQAIHLIIGDLYENREGAILYPGALQTNPTVKRLLDYYRVYR